MCWRRMHIDCELGDEGYMYVLLLGKINKVLGLSSVGNDQAESEGEVKHIIRF